MGVIKRGILGGFSGSVANVVGSSWKGIAVMKSKPLSVANPRTAGQVAQRSKFASAVADAKLILPAIIKPLWDRFAQGQSGYNAWLSANMPAYDSAGDRILDNVIMSEGTLLGANNVSFEVVDDSTQLNITWDSNAGTGNALADDKVYIYFINDTKGDISRYELSATRADESVSLTSYSTNATGDDYYLGIAFKRADGTLVSNAQYEVGVVGS